MKKSLIAAHHYQSPEIIARADLLGDSYKLAVEASKTDAEYIILCGVRFMAESVAILAQENQKILLPNHKAGCPMADMIDRATAQKILQKLNITAHKSVVPITYMNSGADLKSLTGEMGGSICTSGNAKKIMLHYLQTQKTIFFMPDFNLGMNTALSLGVSSEHIWKVTLNGSLEGQGDPTNVKIFLWDGFCPVHKIFTPSDIITTRALFPGIKIIVHPECTPEVVALADENGSTEELYRILKNAEEGTLWAIGTEGQFVERMISEFPRKYIQPLRTSYCPTMNLIDAPRLQATIDSITQYEISNEPLSVITISDHEKKYAKIALETMVRITEG